MARAGAAIELIQPDWPAPATVAAASTTRVGGCSRGPYASLNLGEHVGDERAAVVRNRSVLRTVIRVDQNPRWLQQVHGNTVLDAGDIDAGATADAALTDRPGVPCVIMTADCLPVLLCDRAGTLVAAAHCGWRGLAAGVLEATVTALELRGAGAGELLAWLGPAIGQAAYEVGDEVRASFERAGDPEAFQLNERGRWQLDLYALARSRLRSLGLRDVFGGHWCTWSEPERFFSYRRDGQCGRQATLIWLNSRPGTPISRFGS